MIMKLHLTILLVLVVSPDLAVSYRVLVLHPLLTSGSHVLTLHSLSGELVKQGHHVTTVRFLDDSKIQLSPLGPSHHEVILHVNNSLGEHPLLTKEERSVLTIPKDILWKDGLELLPLFSALGWPIRLFQGYCHRLLGDDRLFEELQEQKFDVALVDLLGNECGLAMAHRLRSPVVAYWAFSFGSFEPQFTTAAAPPSHFPATMTGLAQKMTLWEKFFNVLHKALSYLMVFGHTYLCDVFIRRHYPDSPPSTQLIADLSGVLINSDSILDYPRLLPETFINVGGIQIRRNTKQLPVEIRSWLQGAEHGIVLVAMGNVFDPAAVPDTQLDAIFAALARLPQRVVLKLDLSSADEEVGEKLPPNVLALPFLPQQEILAHNKTLVFFTHCGSHSVMEAIYHAVPMVGMPIFLDQIDVKTMMEAKGIGVGITKTASEEEIYQAIVRVRDDEKFRANVATTSRLMRLRRHHPIEDALWLLDYVVQTRGAKHLLHFSRHMSLVEYFCLDVMLLLLILIYSTYKVLKAILCAGLRGPGKANIKVD